MLARLRAIGKVRLLLALALLVVGVAVGVLIAEARDDGDVVLALVLVTLAAVVLALAWQIRATRSLASQLAEVSKRANRIERVLGSQVRQVAGRADASDTKIQRVRMRLRQLEARLAIVSTASVNFERSRTRAAGDSVAEAGRPADDCELHPGGPRPLVRLLDRRGAR